MAYRNGNYTAFYVAEPFHPSSLGANATKDFQYYNTLRMWKGADATFPFVDSHDKTYSVRDGSDWEYTLKPRLRERLRNSKNIILILSSITTNSRALREEID
ncbi:TIR domain-containing protein, partial [Stutzerimonas stutzeri]